MSDAGTSYTINARVEAEFKVKRNSPALVHGLQLEAEVNDRDRKVEALFAVAPVNTESARGQSATYPADNMRLSAPKGDFHNPYNFIPAPPFKPDPPKEPSLSDPPAKALEQGRPVGHHRWHADRYSGRIEIEIEAVTPLLIPDAFAATATNDHKTFRTLRDEAGDPIMPVTSLKGALRSAYEAITNSRFGLMDGHDWLAYREQTSVALKKSPCRLEEIHSDGSATFAIYDDPDERGRFGMAWFPVRQLGYQKTAHNNHLKVAKAKVVAVDFKTEDVADGQMNFNGKIYSVLDFQFVESGDKHGSPTPKFEYRKSGIRNGKRNHYMENGTPFSCTGYLLASNVGNFGSHHDERLFFVRDDEASKQAFEASKLYLSAKEFERLAKEWSNLIRNARTQNEKALKKDKPGPQGKHSRHLYDTPTETDGTNLKEGDLFYVTLKKDSTGNPQIEAMSPVLISRALYPKSPRALLDPSLHPAETLATLSPADRVFGWANEKGDGAFRGQLRIAPVRFRPGKGISRFESPLSLAILGEPKPAQWLFYGAADKKGTPLEKGAAAGPAGYGEKLGIRGRKSYPHQKANNAAAAYWDRTAAIANARQTIDTTTNGDTITISPTPANAGIDNLYREYVRLAGSHTRIERSGKINARESKASKDSQNRSIEDWVEPGTVFETSIDVINLSGEELGGYCGFWT